MHRLLTDRGGSGERPMQLPKTPHPVWPLTADAPNVVLDLLRGGLGGGQAEEHVGLANRALERLIREGPQAGAHHG